MITLQQGTIYLGTAAPASGGGGSGGTVDQTYDPISENAQSGVAVAEAIATITAFTGADGSVAGSAGLVPAPAASDNTKFLKGDGTWGAITGIQNTATGSGALTILGTATNVGYAINIGNGSMITGGDSGVAVGNSTEVSAIDGIALGHGAKSMQQYAYQIGMGINNTTKSLAVGFGYNGSTPLEYQLLDGTTGKIPLDRMPYSAGTGVTIGNDGTISASGSVSYDNSTINENSSNQLQTIAVVNKNTAVGATNPLNFWEGTSAEYESGGGSQTWYNWQSGGGISANWSSSSGINDYSSSYSNFNGSSNGSIIVTTAANQSQNLTSLSSNNGTTWSNVSTLPSNKTYKAVSCVNNKVYIVCDNDLYTSDDSCATWTNTHFTDWFMPMYPMIYTQNTLFMISSDTTSKYSTDNGTTWTNSTFASSHNSIMEPYADENVIMSVSSYSTNLIRSTDGGKNFSTVTLPVSISLLYNSRNYIAYNGSDTYMLAPGVKQKILKSTDNGASWTAITISAVSSSFYVNGVAYGNGTWVVVSDSTDIVISQDDGITWEKISFTYPARFRNVKFENGFFFLYYRNSYKYLFYSADGKNWYNSNYSLTNDIIDIIYAGNNKYAVISTNGAAVLEVAQQQGSEVFTIDEQPTTSSQVYSAPNTTSALTITNVGTGTITLSDTNTYNYNASGNQTTTQSVGEAHPDWICMIEGVGIKKGNTTIA